MAVWSLYILTALCISPSLQLVKGLCVHEGLPHLNSTIWQTDPCSICSCQNDVAICERIQCQVPSCQFDKGRGFQILPNQCCPECVNNQGSCEYKDDIFGHNTVWESNCETCTCFNGVVECTDKSCFRQRCENGQVLHQTQGDCCPKCISAGRSCTYGSVSYEDGSQWSPVPCTECKCVDGSVQCSVADCPPIPCGQYEHRVVKNGKCCPECVGDSCTEDGKTYEDGRQWQRDGCTYCKCQAGVTFCRSIQCDDTAACQPDERKVKREGQCCSECVSTKASCEYDGRTWYHGDVWNISACEFCLCDSGRITCDVAECSKIECREGEVLEKREGQCCAQCHTPSGYCVYGRKTYRNGDDWSPDACRICHCRSGAVNCFHRTCLPCQPGTYEQTVKGECCPICKPGTCSNDCVGCDSKGCLQCRDGSKLLEDGRCVDRCRTGFYQADEKICQSCHRTCSECSEGTEYHCTVCPNGAMLKYGQCVLDCGPGFYQTDTQCLACHESCLECVGPKKSQCLTCTNTTNLIRRQKCVDSCGVGFYSKDGFCLECDSSCAACEYDSPRCVSCLDGELLQNGVCVSRCQSGYFQLDDSYCEACHPSCAECSGPGKIECTSCKSGHFLLNGMCLSDCSDGFYSDSGVCVACHQSCRTCISRNDDDCLSCRDGTHVVQSRSHYSSTSHGQCVAQCQQGHFSNEHGLCLACHATCKRCIDTTNSGCVSCSSPLVLNDGHCIRQCGQNQYEDRGVCYDCHSSCASCFGPQSTDCSSCNDPARLQYGECLTGCRVSEYPTSAGYCQACHSSCASCVASTSGSGNICTSCNNPNHVVLVDVCVEHCGRGYYRSDGMCHACHQSCATCTSGGSMGCSSCPRNQVLAHTGVCSSTCHDGFYNENGVCRACADNCMVCTSSYYCNQCRNPTDAIQFGECVSQCADQFYSDPMTKICRECDWVCNSCVGPTSFDCIQCMDGMILQNGTCVAECTPGYYQKDQQCRACDSKCKACDGPMSCTECYPPLLLVGNQCVEDCIPQMVKDNENRKCISCPDLCIECTSPLMCVKCYANTFLKNGICVTECGRGFYGNTEIGTCEANIYPPGLSINGTITVPIGTSKVLDASFLTAYDPDTAYLDLIFYIVEPPTNGDLMKNSMGKDSKLNKGDTFKYDELIHGNIRFVHDDLLPLKGTVSLKVNDRQYDSSTQFVDIIAISDSAPQLLHNVPLVVTEGGSGEINTFNLAIFDADNPESLILSVIGGPMHGNMVIMPQGTPVYSFTMDDLRKGNLRYTHDGSETEHDVILMQASDGHNILNIMFDVRVLPQDNQGPILVNNVQARVEEGGMAQVTSNLLSATDLDTPDEELSYKLTPPNDNPKHGSLMMVLPVPSSGIYDGWRDKGNGLMESTVSQFRQLDLDEGRIWYQHHSDEEENDYFMFEVSDTAQPPNILSDQAFNIAVLSTDDEPPQLAAGVPLPLGATVFEGEVIPLGHNHLAFYDPDSPDSDLTYNITQPLKINQGTIEHIDRPFTPVKYFTQADVNAQRIVYRPPPFNGGDLESDDFTFYFSVSDGAGNEIPSQPFTIRLLPTNTAPPSFINKTPVITVSQGGTVPISDEQLTVTDADTKSGDLIYTLSSAPIRGDFIKSEGTTRVILRTGDSFTHVEIARNTFFYVHGGTRNPEDTFEITVSDGNSIDTATITMVVLPVDKSAPVLDRNSLLSLLVPEKSVATVTKEHLSFSDDESAPENIFLTLLSSPRHGKLQRRTGPSTRDELQTGSTITQQDIDHYTIRYGSESEIGYQPITDRITFNVTDGNGNILPNQVLSVTITPVNNQPPVVTVGHGLLVNEGGAVPLTIQDLIATDIDTPLNELVVVMESPPSFGYVESVKKLYGSEYVASGVPQHVFSVQDIIDNVVQYVQNQHQNIEPVQDGFLFHVSDGTNQSPTYRMNISIQLVNDEPPLIIKEQLYCDEGGAAVVTNVTLYVTDLDTSEEDLLFTLSAAPNHGQIRRRDFIEDSLFNGRLLGPGSSFTYQDILDELIGYVHDDSDRQSDSFAVTLSDGTHVTGDTINVIIGLVSDETPRLTINRGLQIRVGSTTDITEEILRATDVDSDNGQLTFTMTKAPDIGQIELLEKPGYIPVTVGGPANSWTQNDINNGRIRYVHEESDPAGTVLLKFTITDPEGNQLIDQSFIITILEDHIPPRILSNNGLVLNEGSNKRITTQLLSATDADSNPADLKYFISALPKLGYLEDITQPGVPIIHFTQSDLAAKTIQYVHTSDEEVYMDTFTFSVDDGSNQITQTFYITIVPVDDSVPQLTNVGMTVQEGVRKTITEFELKATDADTKENLVTFTIVQPPLHGQIQYTLNSLHHSTVNTFTMEDIYENRISYIHDGSNTLQDSFTFSVTDGVNPLFMVKEGDHVITTEEPQIFMVKVLPVDDGTPRLVTNLGLQYLEYIDGRAMGAITKRHLRTIDMDTEDNLLLYTLTTPPQFGFLESTSTPSVPLTTFTQEDINNGLVQYVMYDDVTKETDDSFVFDVADSKPNIVSKNVFRIRWARVSFEFKNYNVSEKDGVVSITVKRTGNLNQYGIVLCRTEEGSAKSGDVGSKPGKHDYVEQAGQVQFEEREDRKFCNVIINDDTIFEGPEMFKVELSMPAYALLGEPSEATVTIMDNEDEPSIEFETEIFQANESAGYLFAPMIRKGDSSTSVSAVCYTIPRTATGSSLEGIESGSDFKTRGMTDEYRVVFPPNINKATCDIKLLDDAMFEEEEEFEIALADPSMMTKLGGINKAMVKIEGPNDESYVFLSSPKYYFGENEHTVEVPVHRHGSDLSHSSMVWCGTRMSHPPSARPGEDFIPGASQITFGPHQTVEMCSFTIVDDIANPHLEGNETFVVYLSSAMECSLAEPHEATVVINDTHDDVPSMQFSVEEVLVKESEGVVHVPIIRTGDVSYESSVRCYTRQRSAQVMMDFDERRNTDDFRVVFAPGEKVKNCTVTVWEDDVYEGDEQFLVRLGSPQGNEHCDAKIGTPDEAKITITNHEDAPTVQIERMAYTVREPPSEDAMSFVTIGIIRTGDQNRTSKVRCSTRDGSAKSGMDYEPKSKVMKFQPGVKKLEFQVEVLFNEAVEWYETFSVVLGPDEPINAVFGPTSMATITILDQEAAGSLVLPAPPLVVSLMDYDDVEAGCKEDPSPGYPLICVTPCDPHYPSYSMTGDLCEESGINASTIHYSWELAAPTDLDGSRPPFTTVNDNTLFTSVNHKVLDSIYFSRRCHVRCVAQPVDNNGNLGIALRSNIVTIGTDNGICHTPIVAGVSRDFQAQSFIATLDYVDSKAKENPNTIHVSVQIPHQDGMLPLISTLPLHNTRFLLTEPVYRQQHVCSNIVTQREGDKFDRIGFLDGMNHDTMIMRPGYDFPYQFNPNIREEKTLLFYQHLDLKTCTWTFDAWYHMTDLIDLCGGTVASDFQVKHGDSYLTVTVPLYAAYIYSTTPTGWASLDHRTQMEFSFFYSTVLWRTGLETEGELNGKLQVLHIRINDDGRLVIDMKTEAKFRGLFVEKHHTLPGFESRVVPPGSLGVNFDIDLLWSEQTFDGPHQLWRATSNYNLKDYSGDYTIELIPCTVTSTQSYQVMPDMPIVCTAHRPHRFVVPIAFQQTNRPVPVVYSLNTQFHLMNNEKVFLLNPNTDSMELSEMDYNGAFSKGQTLFGRVLWNPDQDLETAYRLQIEKLYLCTGTDGYVPTYDPTGSIYDEGPQYGCIQPNKFLKHRFLILDRGAPEVVQRSFNEVPFEAHFAYDNPKYAAFTDMPGVDGFTMNVDALYKIDSGHQWYLQVLYVIGPADALPRYRRSAMMNTAIKKRNIVDSNGNLIDRTIVFGDNSDKHNGTNMRSLKLNQTETDSDNMVQVVTISSATVGSIVCMVIVAVIVIVVMRRRARDKKVITNEQKPSNRDVARQSENARLAKKCEDSFERDLKKTVAVSNINIQKFDNLHSSRVKKVNVDVNVRNNLKGDGGTEV
ncbi:extracellular matrix organizing protein FRAS1-like [Ptychodera flava]|uniref:extracellular matrix organizing protein FRAS1-like n=1 Tax=Ptychodera flava TaxID=63121 RepID=UPI00396A1C27